MADLTAKQRNFVSRLILASEGVLAAVDDLKDIRQEWDDLQYGGMSWAGVFEGDIAHMSLAVMADIADVESTLSGLMDDGARADLLKARA